MRYQQDRQIKLTLKMLDSQVKSIIKMLILAFFAKGMATNIPPHNLNEIMRACTLLVQARQTDTVVSDKQLLETVPAPDFPTGANILGTTGARQLYTTGNGGVIMRATTEIENVVTGKKGQTRTAIIVKELPYQVNKAALLEKIALLVNDKKLDGIADLRDESDRDGIRVVIELKRDAVAAVVLNNLYTKTPLQLSFSGNLLALMTRGGDESQSLVPQRFTLRQALDCFLDFRFETIRKKSRYELSKVEARVHIVDGLLIALEMVDEVIQLIRSAADPKVAKELVRTKLGTSEEQTDAILRLQLSQITRLNKGKLTDEKRSLEESQKALNILLQVDNAVYDVMKDEFKDSMAKFGGERISKIIFDDDGIVSEMDLITNSRSVIVVLRSGYIKRMPLQTFESQNRGTKGKRGTPAAGDSANDQVAHCFTCNDHDTLLMVTQNGIAFGIPAYQVPIASRTAKGAPIPSVLPLSSDDQIATVIPISEFSKDVYLVLATEHGWIKRTALSAFEKLSSRGLTITTLAKDDRLRWCQMCRDNDTILFGTKMGQATRFQAAKLRPTGRTSRGLRAMKLREGDRIADMNVLGDGEGKEPEFALAITSQGYGKRVPTGKFRIQARGGLGVVAVKFKDGNTIDDKLTCLLSAREDDEVLLITAKGIMVRQKVKAIPVQGRAARGVTLQKLGDGDFITTVSIVPQYDEIDTL
jgi:DNA gyrase subunit A